jgi:flagellar biosynthetic protein FlhB
MTAPKVVAKGADLIAQKIKEVAKEHNVPIVEDKPLAQALYKAVDIGEEVPEQLFQAVAQVLAYIYRLRDQKTRTYSR